ncbi:UNVERIFIED_CONTAM: hypothetical protein Slati_1957300 [Sesamum latifolium]|uniref:RBR-type E3 ubiquitin transferase n=1 Tax=Sesamum latifolium TaxID=2727402 RepID=A0AAW2WR67_9LAMI
MVMEEQRVLVDNVYLNGASEFKLEEDDDDFRSCCEDEDELKEREEYAKVDLDSSLDEDSLKMYFKGVSVAGPGDSGSRISGIGWSWRAIQSNIRRVYAFTDSEVLYNQIIHDEVVESPLLLALRERILEQASNIESFSLKLIPPIDLQKALHLAQVAVGIVSFPADGEETAESCSICCEEKLSSMMLTIKCSHKFCSHCMKTYVEGKLQSAQVPIRCPQLRCKYCISASECRSFLPVTSYESLERALAEANVLSSNKIYCPYPSCSVLLDPHECSSTRASSSSQSDNSCVECPVEALPTVPENELTHGCYHMTCWCGHEFCYSCGAGYRDGQQTCQCAFWDEDYSEDLATYPTQQFEQWAWDSFESLPMMMDAYSEQERSQLALIQRFLAGGFSLTEHHPYQSPPRCTDSYADAMKDLHQLPWLERFVSVISDNYYEDYIQ